MKLLFTSSLSHSEEPNTVSLSSNVSDISVFLRLFNQGTFDQVES